MALLGKVAEEAGKGGFGNKLMAGVGSGLASGLAGAGLNLIFGGLLNKRAYNQQQKLQELQIKGSKELTDYNAQKELEMWNATNAEAQRKHLEDAGLSVSLMYGGAGAGGATTGGGGGAMPSGDSGSAQLMAGMNAQSIMADIGLKIAQAEKTKAEAEKLKGVDTELGETQIENLKAGITNTKAQTDLTRVQEKISDLDYTIKNDTFNDVVKQAHFISHLAHEAMKIAQNDRTISDATVKQKIDIVNTELVGALLKNQAIEQGIEKSKAEINKIAQDILQGWEALKLKGDEINIKDFEAKIKAEYPNAMGVVGKSANDFFEGLMSILGGGFKPRK